jgi:hypothetical protein
LSLASSLTLWRSTMPERSGLFAPPKHPVLSLAVQAEDQGDRREQSQFEILVRHIFYRFLHNELLTSDDDETKRVMLISGAIAVPGMLVALFLFPAYHAFPPYPVPRPFWAQVGDHYFYVMYAFVVMGLATVFEWDLLFPDLVDVFVLSIQPIASRDLFFARVLALAIFLGLVLFGTSILGILFLPLVAELPYFLRHLLAHSAAVFASGTFAAATFLALHGILLNVVGENIFRRITPLLQGTSVMLLLTILLLHPTLSMSLKPLLTSGAPAVRFFPPFWFLGIYERLLIGPSALTVFHEFARIGCYALLLTLACAVLTYPLAYRRRVRQLIEGGRAVDAPSHTAAPFRWILQATIVRIPAQRAIFHFISQTILRAQRQRVMLAMYGGLGVALALSDLLVFRVSGGHVRPILLPSGIRTAIPVMVFWTVAGLRSVLTSPVDRRGAWLFHVIIGRPKAVHFAGTRIWVTLWAAIIGLTTAVGLHALSPQSLGSRLTSLDQLLIAIGVSLLLADIFLFSVRTVPFTHIRKGSITDLPLVIVRYVVLFPLLITILVHNETWTEVSPQQFLKAVLFVVAAHFLLLKVHTRSLLQSTLDTPPDEADEFPQRLGLRDF